MYVGVSRVTSKGQITIPAEIRQSEKMKEGTEVLFVDMDGFVVIKKITELKNLFSVFEKKAAELKLSRQSVEKEVENEKARTWKVNYEKGND